MNETLSSDDEEGVNLSQNKSETETTSLVGATERATPTTNDRIQSVEGHPSKTNLLEHLTTSTIANNISRNKGHVIIPLSQADIIASSDVPKLTTEQNCKSLQDTISAKDNKPSSLNENDGQVPIQTQKWSFTAAAMKNRELSCKEWEEDTSSSEDEEDLDNQFLDKTKSNANLNDITNIKQYNNSPDISKEEWLQYEFVANNHKNNDIFCSTSSTGKNIIAPYFDQTFEKILSW